MLSFLIKSSILLLVSVGVSAKCTSPGEVTCNDDCSGLILCLGEAHEIVVESCIPETYCYAPKKECSKVHNTCNNTVVYPITCHAVGYFPDPYDCKWFHICEEIDVESIPRKCQEGRGYNAQTYSCIIQLVDGECPQVPFPDCASVGQVSVNSQNPSIFGVCIYDEERGLIYDIYSCDLGNPFDPDTLSCPEWRDDPEPKSFPFMKL